MKPVTMKMPIPNVQRVEFEASSLQSGSTLGLQNKQKSLIIQNTKSAETERRAKIPDRAVVEALSTSSSNLYLDGKLLRGGLRGPTPS